VSAHSSVVGGSTAGRVIACPPSRLLSEGVEREPPSEYAEEGTLLHTAMEVWVNGVYATDLSDADHLVKVRSAQKAYNGLVHIDDHELVEQRVQFTPVPDAFGTIDVLIDHGDNHVTVLDWKFGEGVQVYPDSDQLRFMPPPP